MSIPAGWYDTTHRKQHRSRGAMDCMDTQPNSTIVVYHLPPSKIFMLSFCFELRRVHNNCGELQYEKGKEMLEQSAFVRAAFHWCDAMKPKAQPTFQLKGMDSTSVGVRSLNLNLN